MVGFIELLDSIISEVIIDYKYPVFWLVETLGLWGYNHPARDDIALQGLATKPYQLCNPGK